MPPYFGKIMKNWLIESDSRIWHVIWCEFHVNSRELLTSSSNQLSNSNSDSLFMIYNFQYILRKKLLNMEGGGSAPLFDKFSLWLFITKIFIFCLHFTYKLPICYTVSMLKSKKLTSSPWTSTRPIPRYFRPSSDPCRWILAVPSGRLPSSFDGH